MGSGQPDHELLHFNGVNAVTGGYGLAPMSVNALANRIRREPRPENLKDLVARRKRDQTGSEAIARLTARRAALGDALAKERVPAMKKTLEIEISEVESELSSRRHLGVKEGIDETRLDQAGWGVIFPAGADPAIKAALSPLLALRAAQAGSRFRIYEGKNGHHGPGDDKSSFLTRSGASPSGPADPDRVPYYLLIVGSPEEIPFTFQYQLDVQYAVGRLHLDSPAAYTAYAENVVAVETRGTPRPKRVSFFGVENEDDPATRLSCSHLVEPLVEAITRDNAGRGWGFTVDAFLRERATRGRLDGLLGGGGATPALLFTASHGLEFPLDDERLVARQGALLCSDWPGPKGWSREIPDRFYLAAEHLGPGADLRGLIVLAFACHSGGTPLHDAFSCLDGEGARPRQIARAPFVSSLSKALLGRRNGALAMIAHVDRAWGCSFSGWTAAGGSTSYTEMFRSALLRLLGGSPVGHAFEYFNERYAELSTVLNEALDAGRTGDPLELASLWVENNDARGYVVLGDPAARLVFGGEVGAPTERDAATPAAPPAGAGDGPTRPPAISEEDWLATPAAVRAYIARGQK